MNKKKIIILLTCLISIVVAAVAVVFSLNGKKTKKITNTDYVTVSQWIEILADHTGCDDIALPVGYTNDSLADGKLIAITAMKTISVHKYERFIDDIDSYTDDDYYKLAITYGLLPSDKKNYNIDECNDILARYNEIYTDDLWLDDYCEMELQDGVKELDAANPVTVNEDSSVVSFADNSVISQGDIVIYTDNNGYKRAGRVDSIDESGACHMSQPELEEVVTELDLSDKVGISYDDIVKSGAVEGELVGKTLASVNYAAESDFAADNPLNYTSENNIKNPANNAAEDPFHYETSSGGFKITLSVEDNDNFDGNFLSIEIADNDSGESAKYISPINIGDTASGSIAIDFSDINVSADTTYFQFNESKKYAEFNVDMDTTLEGELTLETGDDDFKIPIAHLNVPFEGGFVSLDFEVYLQISAKGTISVKATFPTSVCIRQEQGNGIRMVKSIGQPNVEKAIEGEVMLSANLDTKLYVLWIWDIFGAGIKAGAVGKASIIERDTGMICTDIKVLFPVVTGNVYFNAIFQKLEFEFDIVSEDNAMTIWHRHYETVPGVRDGEVLECSYGNGELFAQYNAEAGATEENVNTEASNPDNANTYGGNPDISKIYGHDLYSRFDINVIGVEDDMNRFDITDTGSGYILVGKVIAPYRISGDRFYDYINAGTFTILGTTFTVASNETELESRSDITLLGDDGITYKTGSAAWLLSDEFGSYYELDADSDGDGIPDERKNLVIENAAIFVPYDMAGENIKRIYEYGASGIDMNGIEIYGIKLDDQGNLIDMVGARESILNIKEEMIY